MEVVAVEIIVEEEGEGEVAILAVASMVVVVAVASMVVVVAMASMVVVVAVVAVVAVMRAVPVECAGSLAILRAVLKQIAHSSTRLGPT